MPTISFYVKDEVHALVDHYGEHRKFLIQLAREAFEQAVLTGATPETHKRMTHTVPTRVSSARTAFLESLEKVPLVLTKAERNMIRVALDYYRREHPAGEVTENDLQFLMGMLGDPALGYSVDLAELRKQNSGRSMHDMLLESRNHLHVKGNDS
jgi:hypothetical protein